MEFDTEDQVLFFVVVADVVVINVVVVDLLIPLYLVMFNEYSCCC